MKKLGFTLAEVLIALSIVGVLAAITLPTLMSDTQSAQVGPKLGKAAAMLEQANMAMLEELGADALSETALTNDDYGASVSNFLKITRNRQAYPADNVGENSNPAVPAPTFGNNAQTWLAKDGIMYNFFYRREGNNLLAGVGGARPHQQNAGYVFIDINGTARPNLPGSDVFAFRLKNDGSLKPVGSGNWNGVGNELFIMDVHGNVLGGGPVGGGNGTLWTVGCPNDAEPTLYYTCTGSIFENNMKVMYQMR